MSQLQRLLYPARIFILNTLLEKNTDYRTFKLALKMNDGNLWSNIRALLEIKAIDYRKEVDDSGKKVITMYRITEKGKIAYNELKENLLQLLQ